MSRWFYTCNLQPVRRDSGAKLPPRPPLSPSPPGEGPPFPAGPGPPHPWPTASTNARSWSSSPALLRPVDSGQTLTKFSTVAGSFSLSPGIPSLPFSGFSPKIINIPVQQPPFHGCTANCAPQSTSDAQLTNQLTLFALRILFLSIHGRPPDEYVSVT